MLAVRYYDSFTAKHLKEATIKRGMTSTGIVSFLLQHADVNTHNASGTTPLALAVQKQNEAITELLLDNPDIIIDKPNPQGYAPLHFACIGQNTNIITMLLEKGANMFSKTDKGYIPFHIACRRGNVEALELLIQRCPEEDTKTLTKTKKKSKKSWLKLKSKFTVKAGTNYLKLKTTLVTLLYCLLKKLLIQKHFMSLRQNTT